MKRLSRLRQSAQLRDLLCETRLSLSDFILPLFIKEGLSQKQAISSMPGHYQLSLSDVTEEAKQIQALGIPGVILFGIPTHKDAIGSAACKPDNIVSQAIQKIKTVAPELLIITDLCFCEYTDHGHCGIWIESEPNGKLDHDRTVEYLVEQALQHVRAGASIIAPSGMIDGMVQGLRKGLDLNGYTHIPILSYAAKYASAFYGPFREAAESTPKAGDRRSYQMNPANYAEASREVETDIAEGADMIMVKPAGAYLDVIQRVKQTYPAMPLAAYQVSGEFAMIKVAASLGYIDERAAALESLISIKRAGADFILSYFAKQIAQWL